MEKLLMAYTQLHALQIPRISVFSLKTKKRKKKSTRVFPKMFDLKKVFIKNIMFYKRQQSFK